LSEEAGAENIAASLNTLLPKSLGEFEAALTALLRQGLVQLYKDLGRAGLNYVPLTDEEISEVLPLETLVTFDPQKGYWCWKTAVSPDVIEGVRLTRKGEEALFS
jgi:hypothetical protein